MSKLFLPPRETGGKTSGSWKFIPNSFVLAHGFPFGSPTNIYIPSSPPPPLLASHHSSSPLHNPSQNHSRPSDRANPQPPLLHDSPGAAGVASGISWHNLNPHPPIHPYVDTLVSRLVLTADQISNRNIRPPKSLPFSA
ncbi:uncharacterized protein EAE98_004568 [Botrytis deweyae]|uniref:Uncharacterized protein n=1 Tax=Botrytis deweyae TaxID=2478750 RepID=A0ABQ7IR87_9HELO|nr:uncharacterized protein EAE98_004568 [Botrytis deweyae]KAF7931832.1 hypothetical protein EAE98_004568 [Botrytis deweyae]